MNLYTISFFYYHREVSDANVSSTLLQKKINPRNSNKFESSNIYNNRHNKNKNFISISINVFEKHILCCIFLLSIYAIYSFIIQF